MYCLIFEENPDDDFYDRLGNKIAMNGQPKDYLRWNNEWKSDNTK
jgi:hypothetical protein